MWTVLSCVWYFASQQYQTLDNSIHVLEIVTMLLLLLIHIVYYQSLWSLFIAQLFVIAYSVIFTDIVIDIATLTGYGPQPLQLQKELVDFEALIKESFWHTILEIWGFYLKSGGYTHIYIIVKHGRHITKIQIPQ